MLKAFRLLFVTTCALVLLGTPAWAQDVGGIGLPLDLRGLMYTEGGHEAQLYVDAPEHEYEFVGSFGEADDNHRAWPVPNVLGIVRKTPG